MAGLVVLGLRAGLVVGILSGMVSFPVFAGFLGVLSATERRQFRQLLGAVAPRRGARRSGSPN
jgi:hypothetical protein